jgi:REP element-mobilizing transposase RayT
MIKPCDAENPACATGWFFYHVNNRGNGRATIFHKAQDCQAFLSIVALATARHPVKMFAFSLMPNHFHFFIEASHHQSLSRFMQWLLTSQYGVITSITAAAVMFRRAGLKVSQCSAPNIC